MGVDGSRTVFDRHSLQAEAGASRHLRADICREGQEAVPKLMHLGARHSRTNRRTARGDSPNCPDDPEPLGGDLGLLDSRSDRSLNGETQ